LHAKRLGEHDRAARVADADLSRFPSRQLPDRCKNPIRPCDD